eukprot:scaffold303795_cov32-Tisochrysis_lutea.AAC.2
MSFQCAKRGASPDGKGGGGGGDGGYLRSSPQLHLLDVPVGAAPHDTVNVFGAGARRGALGKEGVARAGA